MAESWSGSQDGHLPVCCHWQGGRWVGQDKEGVWLGRSTVVQLQPPSIWESIFQNINN